MGYSKDKDGNVVLVMTQKDYDELLLVIGFALGSTRLPGFGEDIMRLLDRVCEKDSHPGTLYFTGP